MIRASLWKFPLDWTTGNRQDVRWFLRHKNGTDIMKLKRLFSCAIETPKGTIIYRKWRGMILCIMIKRLFKALQYKDSQVRKERIYREATEHFRPWSTNEGRFVEKL